MKLILAFLLVTGCLLSAASQPVSGVWKGKVMRGSGFGKQSYKLELKLVKKGDSLVGTSYYYTSGSNYYRYSVKGYFDARDNSVNWWDDQLIESKSGGLKLGSFNTMPMVAEADFNCPGSGIMKLDGSAHPKLGGNNFEIHMDKDSRPDFKDEWDPVIENYFYGGADPDVIDSVSRIAFNRTPIILATPAKTAPARPVMLPPTKPEVAIAKPVEKQKAAVPVVIKEVNKAPLPDIVKVSPPVVIKPMEKKPEPVVVKPLEKKPDQVIVEAVDKTPDPIVVKPIAKRPEPVLAKAPQIPTVDEKFATRKNVFTTEIPILSDSIEFRFYDNAEVDGDSISVYLNQRLVETHIRLTEKAYVIKIATANLHAENELVMVAENLGSIPPNTAYMEAWSGGIRYSARLESTELSSAMIKLVRR
ncbi:MAG: hypothetical protein ABIX01_20805 [Chitinophagaceae bacterium]